MSNMRVLYRKEVTDHLHLQTVEACRENMPRPTKTDKIICNKKQLRRQIFCILVKLFSSNNVMPSIFETLQAVWDKNNWRQCRNLKWNGLRMRIHSQKRYIQFPRRNFWATPPERCCFIKVRQTIFSHLYAGLLSNLQQKVLAVTFQCRETLNHTNLLDFPHCFSAWETALFEIIVLCSNISTHPLATEIARGQGRQTETPFLPLFLREQHQEKWTTAFL